MRSPPVVRALGIVVGVSVMTGLGCDGSEGPPPGPPATAAPATIPPATEPPATIPPATIAPVPAKGRVDVTTIAGTASGFGARPTHIYLPPIYDAAPEATLPVVLVLGDVPGAADEWIAAGRMVQTADAFAARNGGRAPILVATDFSGDGLSDTQCTDGARGRAETYLTVDVLGHLRRTYRVAPPPAAGVAGLSSGGFCAVMLPLRHPDQFSVFATSSGRGQPTIDGPTDVLTGLFGGDRVVFDAYDATRLLATNKYPDMSGWFEVGRQDPMARERVAEAMSTLASNAGVATCVTVRDGGHDHAFWSVAFERSLPWMSWRLGIAPEPRIAGAQCYYP
jgi:S-formylglutathione hydrolase FrmB